MIGATWSEVAPFHVHWDVFGLALALVVGYVYGLRVLAPDHAPKGEPAVTRRQKWLFGAGVATLLLASSWPVHDIGENSLYSVHMVEHLLLSFAVPPLLMYGTPWWLTRMLVLPILPLMRVLTRPLVALFLFNAVLGILHIPGVVEAMVTSRGLHFVAHAALFATSILMWWPVIGPIPDLPRLPPFLRMGYLFLQSLVPTIPASFLTLGETPLYKVYETFPRLWGLDPLTDQIVAGLIMKLIGGLVLWGFIAGVFFTWWSDEKAYNRPQRLVKPSA